MSFSNLPRRTLVVVGAGPKGIAVAVKAKVLEEFGQPVDRVILVEKNGVAAHWSGDFGYTNGEMKLGTSPEKDVVFPLETDIGDPELNERLRQRLLHFTWNSFLVQTGRFSDWVDRGRPAPCHQLWALYLQWVSAQLSPQVMMLTAEVAKADIDSQGRWELHLQTPEGMTQLTADRLMLTGPGRTRNAWSAEGETTPAGVFDLESFWGALKSGEFRARGRLAIVGAGENAASALLALSKTAPHLQVDLISPKGFISTRAESFYENQMYSQPDRNGWKSLSPADRTDFIERTDLGVFSVHAMQILNDQLRHRIIPGRLICLKTTATGLSLRLDYHGEIRHSEYDQVILATGFDQVSTLKTFLSEKARTALEKSLGADLSPTILSQRIGDDLAVEGFTPGLHLPMLAGLRQGPGFANLSCLGRLADRVMRPTTKTAHVIRKEA